MSVQTPVRQADGQGGYTDTWVTLGPAWASIEPATISNIEHRVGHQVEAKISHVVTIRYLAGVLIAGRILYGSRVFQIRSISNRHERNILMTLACEELIP